MQKNENRPGYKKTKVGWIPVDWQCVRLGQVFEKRTARGAEGVPVYSVSQEHGLVRRDSLERRVETKLSPRDSLLVEPGDIAYNTMRMWQGAVDVSRETCVVSPAYVVCRPKADCVNSDFMHIFFKSPFGLYKLWSYSYGVVDDRLRLYFRDFQLVPAPLPSLPEQEAIAEVLDCWDKAIRGYERKIETKRVVKKGLMQGLLSGRRRLPGFGDFYHEGHEEHEEKGKGIPSGWEEVRFGEVFSFLKTYAFSRAELTTDNRERCSIHNIHYGDLHATYEGCILDCSREERIPSLRNNADLPSKPVMLQDGDLVIADVSEDYEGVCACIELKDVGNRKITGGLHTFVARDENGKTAAGYRGYILREDRTFNELMRIATGVSVHGVSKSNLSKVNLLLPGPKEQKAIAAVLSSADAEISSLERKLAGLKDQKRFLLNNLVTGTIRLPAFETTETTETTESHGNEKDRLP